MFACFETNSVRLRGCDTIGFSEVAKRVNENGKHITRINRGRELESFRGEGRVNL